MSSHHFVREGQEPALLFIDPVPFAVIADVLEWAPFVAVSAAALERVLSWGIKIDAVVCRPDEEASVTALIGARFPYVTISHRGDDVIPAAVAALSDRGESGICIVSSHPVSIMQALGPDKERLPLVVLAPDARWTPVANEFRKWIPAGTTLRVFGVDPNTLITRNLALSGAVFSAVADGDVSLQAPIPFWVGESNDKENPGH